MPDSSSFSQSPLSQRPSRWTEDPDPDIGLNVRTRLQTTPGTTAADWPTSPTVPQSSPENRVKITLWRTLNTIFLLAVGIGKAVSTYQGYSTAPNTLDWVIGVLWAVISYWVSILESECPDSARWLFEHDTRISVSIIWLIQRFLWLVLGFAVLLSDDFWRDWAGSVLEDHPHIILVVTLLSVFPVLVLDLTYYIGKIINRLLRSSVPQWMDGWMRLLRLFSSSDWEWNSLTLLCAILMSLLFEPPLKALFRSMGIGAEEKSWRARMVQKGSSLIAFVAGTGVAYLLMGFIRMAMRLSGLSTWRIPILNEAKGFYADILLCLGWRERRTPNRWPYSIDLVPWNANQSPLTAVEEPTPSATAPIAPHTTLNIAAIEEPTPTSAALRMNAPRWRLSRHFSSSDWEILGKIDSLLLQLCTTCMLWLGMISGGPFFRLMNFDRTDSKTLHWKTHIAQTCLVVIFSIAFPAGGYLLTGFIRMAMRLSGLTNLLTSVLNAAKDLYTDILVCVGRPQSNDFDTGTMPQPPPTANGDATLNNAAIEDPTQSALVPGMNNTVIEETAPSTSDTVGEKGVLAASESTTLHKAKEKERAIPAPVPQLEEALDSTNLLSKAKVDLRAEMAPIAIALQEKQAQVAAHEQSLIELTQQVRALADIVMNLNIKLDLAPSACTSQSSFEPASTLFAVIPKIQAPLHPSEPVTEKMPSAPSPSVHILAQDPDAMITVLHTSSPSVTPIPNSPARASPTPIPVERTPL